MMEKKDQTQFNFNLNNFFQAFLLLVCALSLSLVAIRLGPVAKWANYQSTCVEEISRTYPISYSVRKCNGRSKVYQVK